MSTERTRPSSSASRTREPLRCTTPLTTSRSRPFLSGSRATPMRSAVRSTKACIRTTSYAAASRTSTTSARRTTGCSASRPPRDDATDRHGLGARLSSREAGRSRLWWDERVRARAGARPRRARHRDRRLHALARERRPAHPAARPERAGDPHPVRSDRLLAEDGRLPAPRRVHRQASRARGVGGKVVRPRARPLLALGEGRADSRKAMERSSRADVPHPRPREARGHGRGHRRRERHTGRDRARGCPKIGSGRRREQDRARRAPSSLPGRHLTHRGHSRGRRSGAVPSGPPGRREREARARPVRATHPLRRADRADQRDRRAVARARSSLSAAPRHTKRGLPSCGRRGARSGRRRARDREDPRAPPPRPRAPPRIECLVRRVAGPGRSRPVLRGRRSVRGAVAHGIVWAGRSRSDGLRYAGRGPARGWAPNGHRERQICASRAGRRLSGPRRRHGGGPTRPRAPDASRAWCSRAGGAVHLAPRRRPHRRSLRSRARRTKSEGLVTDVFTIPKRAMAVFAHPDDVDFGCSGTLASWIRTAGTHVTYCVITSGQKGTHDLGTTAEQMAETRQREQRAAGEAIGVKEFVFLGHQDGELEVSMNLRGEVCRVIREHRPDVVFTNDPWRHYQVHPDHRVAGWSGLDGVIAARDHLFFPEQLTGGLKHHRVARVLLFGTRDPNIWFDISGSIDGKIAALKAHKSQVGGRRGFAERMRWWAKNTGATWNLAAAEAFRYIELA